MIDESNMRHQIVVTIITSVVKKTALLTGIFLLTAVAYALISNTGQRWWFMPASILFGGILGALNFLLLALTIERIYGQQGASARILKIALMAILKLVAIFVVLFIVIKWSLLHILGVLLGFSLCFLAIVWEGLIFSSRPK